MELDINPILDFVERDEGNNPIIDADGLPLLRQIPAFKTAKDIEYLISINKPLCVIEQFAKLVSEGEQWQFALNYIQYLRSFSLAVSHNETLIALGKDEDDGDILVNHMPLPVAPIRPPVKSVDDVLSPFKREIFKIKRSKAISNIQVEVDGMIFDGDEASTTRISHRVLVMSDTDVYNWTLANNDVAPVTKEQLSRVFKLAIEEQSKLWN